MPGGRVVSVFKVRCMRSWRPFCVGLPGLMRSMAMPSLSHQTGEPREIVETVGRSEGQAVVGADGLGQAALGKQAMKAPSSYDRPAPFLELGLS
jgi:hypothetical protein